MNKTHLAIIPPPEVQEQLSYLTDYDAENNTISHIYLFLAEKLINTYLLNNLEPPIELHPYHYTPKPISLPNLYPHQNTMLSHVLATYHHPMFNGFVLNATMSSGKTFVALEFLKRIKPKNTLIIASKTILENVWYPRITEFNINATLTTYDSIHKHLRNRWQIVIVDESHNLRNYRTQKAQSFYSLSKQYTLFLTATPVINHAGDIYLYASTILKNLPLPSYDAFMFEFMKMKQTAWQAYKWIKIKPERKTALKALFESLSYTLTPKDIGIPTPEITIVNISIPYNIQREQDVEKHKFRYIYKMLLDKKAVIVYKYKATRNLILKTFSASHKLKVIDGETTDRTIPEDVDYLLLSLGVGMEGIDLTAFETMFILTPPFSSAQLNQLTARLWRKQEENFTKPIYLITSKSSYDKIKQIVMDNKIEVISLINSN